MRLHTDALPMTSAYFHLILREFGATPRHRRTLLAGTGLGSGEPTEITLGQQLRQIRNANDVLPPEWALTIGARLHAATHGAVGVAAVSAPTLREGLGIMSRFGHVRSPHFRMRVAEVGNDVFLFPEDRVVLADDERRRLLDLVLLSMQGLVEALLGRPMHGARVELPDGSAEHPRRCPDWFHAPVRYGRPAPAVVVPRAWLDLECPLADPALFATSLRALTATERRATSWPARVEGHVVAHPGRTELGEVARALGVSSRTLVRRLGEAGTSYRALLEDCQKAHAEALLRERHLGVAEVAWALGYEDAANFGRAFRRWFGMSPGRYRASLRSRT